MNLMHLVRDLTCPILWTQSLLRIPSVTPKGLLCLQLIAEALIDWGFQITPFHRDSVSNLYAVRPSSKTFKSFAFAGHVDTVPAGDLAQWKHNPWSGTIDEAQIYGRGACDMKGAIACFLAAVARNLDSLPNLHILLTSDEEGSAISGTKWMVQQLQNQLIYWDFCLIGEPTSVHRIGDTIKAGRRGSFSASVTIRGQGGHVAYPHLAANPMTLIPQLLKVLNDLISKESTAYFGSSNLEVIGIQMETPPVWNMIPSSVIVSFNIRFNPLFSLTQIQSLLEQAMEHFFTSVAFQYTLQCYPSSESFHCNAPWVTEFIQAQLQEQTGQKGTLSTGGGTSDGRFLQAIAPVIELGLLTETAHQIDERVPLSHLEQLCQIYGSILRSWGLQ
jgi:succinyl-diaminopimelate desuccinylase